MMQMVTTLKSIKDYFRLRKGWETLKILQVLKGGGPEEAQGAGAERSPRSGAERHGASARRRAAAGRAISFLPTPPAALGGNCPAQKAPGKGGFQKPDPKGHQIHPKRLPPLFFPSPK